jgi:hypothetical protein
MSFKYKIYTTRLAITHCVVIFIIKITVDKRAGRVAEISLENSLPCEMCMHIFVRDKFQQL